LAPKTLPTVLVDAQNKLRNGDLAGALELAQKAVSDSPDSKAARLVLGMVDFRRGEILAAEMDFKKALQLDDQFARAWLGLGRVFECASFQKKAQVCYRRAHQLDPEDPEILRAWASTLKRSERVTVLEKNLGTAGEGEDSDRVKGARSSLEANRALGDRKLWRLVSGEESSRVKFAMLLNGLTSLRGYGLLVSINGSKPFKLMIDTGASGILINSRAAEKAGVQRLAAMRFGGIGDSGVQDGYRALAEKVRVGGVEFEDCVVDVSDKKAVADEDGLIGMDVFSHFLVTLDFYKQELRLDPLPKHQAAAAEGEPEDREIAPEMRGFSPVFRFGHALMIPTKVSSSKPVLFLIDTGAMKTLISPELARQVTKVRSEDLVKMKGLSGDVKNVYTADRAELEFAGFRQNNFDIISFDLSGISKSFGAEVSGVLGLPVLQMFVLKIDYRDGLVHFDYQGPVQ
jgi:Flp pilus assembly protein TadD/predicted aspartyl protease